MIVDEQVLDRTAERCRERGIVIPTFAQLRNPELIPGWVKERLADVSLWDVDPANLFRISWWNEPVEKGGLYGQGNFIEFDSSLTGVDARIVGLVGKWFPTGAHKVGAGFGCLVPKLVTGEFDPTRHKAVWPSTGNFCRGGAFDCAVLGCDAIGILPEEMSRERFEWLKAIGAEIIATPGCESNVKEIYDKCAEIRDTRDDCVIFNQFCEFGNAAWHYHATGTAMEKVYHQLAGPRDRFAAFCSATGSAGTINAGDYLRTRFPHLRVVAVEALQCPTLLEVGYGGHGIEGIGDKHVPWIHNVRNTDVVAAIDDRQCLGLSRLFNEDAGRVVLRHEGVPDSLIDELPLLGISSICNLVAAIKTARHFDLDRRDFIVIPLTDGMDLYQSRLDEMNERHGPLDERGATRILGGYLDAITDDHLRELGYRDRKAIHNLKYFTWVEQQGKTVEELDQLWDPDHWTKQYAMVDEWDDAIESFNARVGRIGMKS